MCWFQPPFGDTGHQRLFFFRACDSSHGALGRLFGEHFFGQEPLEKQVEIPDVGTELLDLFNGCGMWNPVSSLKLTENTVER